MKSNLELIGFSCPVMLEITTARSVTSEPSKHITISPTDRAGKIQTNSISRANLHNPSKELAMFATKKTAPKSNYNAPRFRPPFNGSNGKTAQGFWYVWHDGKQHRLAGTPAENFKPGSRDYAGLVMPAYLDWVKTYEARKLAEANHAEIQAVATSGPVVVGQVCKAYLTRLEADLTKSESYKASARRYLTDFCLGKDNNKGHGDMAATLVTKSVLADWVASHPGWKESKTALTPIRAAYNLAVEDGLLDRLPFGVLKIGKGRSRQDYFSPADEAAFRAAITSPNYADFFAACIETGARPGELATLTPAHVKEAQNGLCWRLDMTEWKAGRKTQTSRVIYLSAKWVDWTKARLAEIGEGGHLFTTRLGGQWTKEAWGSCFRDVARKIGIKKALCQYSCRHTFVTRKLLAGLSASKVAAYCGTSEEEIRGHYNHLINESQEMIAIAEMAV